MPPRRAPARSPGAGFWTFLKHSEAFGSRAPVLSWGEQGWFEPQPELLPPHRLVAPSRHRRSGPVAKISSFSCPKTGFLAPSTGCCGSSRNRVRVQGSSRPSRGGACSKPLPRSGIFDHVLHPRSEREASLENFVNLGFSWWLKIQSISWECVRTLPIRTLPISTSTVVEARASSSVSFAFPPTPARRR